MSESSAKNYSKAFIYLNKFVDAGSYSLAEPTAEMLEEWCVFLYYFGFQTKTVMHYLDVYSALHKGAVAEGLAEPTQLFKLVKAKVKSGDIERRLTVFSTENYTRLHKLITLSDKLPRPVGQLVDIFVVSMLLGCRPLREIAMMKKGDIESQSAQIATILERNTATNRQYVFPLSQNTRTPLQLQKHLEKEISEIFQSRGITVVGSVQETARCFWAYTAIKRNVPLADIYAALGKLPMAIPDIQKVVSAGDSKASKVAIVANVSDALLENPVNWYAMRLRQASKFEEVKRRIEEVEESIRPIEIFYPASEIKKRIKGGRKGVSRPIIPGVVFFKSKVNNVQPLFAQIGDLAWCYRSVEGDRQYAVIPRNEMTGFQRAIGQFTADFEVGPIGSLEPREGDTIRVVGGIFDGYQGEIQKIIAQAEAGVIYRLKVVDGQGVEWRIALDSRYAEPK